MSMEKEIKDFLKDGKDWEQLPLSKLEGAHVVKMPATKTRPALLAIEINPVKDGKPLKRKGLFVTNTDMLTAFQEIIMNDSLYNLMKTVDGINIQQMPVGKPRKPLTID